MAKFKPIRYHSGEGLAKIKLEDDSGKNFENWTIMMSDLTTWFETMKRKYGSQIESKKKEEDHDLDWLR